MAGRAGRPPVPEDARFARLLRVARLLDSQFRIPGLGFRFGLDGVVGLIPGVGDTATALAGLYVLFEARRLGVRKRTLLRMAANLAVDAAAGTVPVIGDVFDFMWKANHRNVRLIEREIAARADARTGTPGGGERSRRELSLLEE